MYGDQFGEFVCGYWGLKSTVGETNCIKLSAVIMGIHDPLHN